MLSHKGTCNLIKICICQISIRWLCGVTIKDSTSSKVSPETPHNDVAPNLMRRLYLYGFRKKIDNSQ